MEPSRYEYKYRVTEHRARMIAAEVACFMRPDEHAARSADKSYTISSLYLDSAALHCYSATSRGERDRFKLRMRWYADELCAPVFLEEKRRVGEAIFKLRAPLAIDGARRLMEGGEVRETDFPLNRTGGASSAALLLERVRSINARGTCVVRYRREAWVSPMVAGLRITFDRHLCAVPLAGSASEALRSDIPGDVILEIKFRGGVPEWIAGIVRRHGLARCSVPKYLMCVDALEECGRANLRPLPARAAR